MTTSSCVHGALSRRNAASTQKFYLGHYDIDWQTTIRCKGFLIERYGITYVHIGGLSTTWLFMNHKEKLRDWIYEKNRIEMHLKKHKNTFKCLQGKRTETRQHARARKIPPAGFRKEPDKGRRPLVAQDAVIQAEIRVITTPLPSWQLCTRLPPECP